MMHYVNSVNNHCMLLKQTNKQTKKRLIALSALRHWSVFISSICLCVCLFGASPEKAINGLAGNFVPKETRKTLYNF